MASKHKRSMWRWAIAVAALFAVYVLSYFILGEHSSGKDFVLGYPRTKRYVWHDRRYPFDPWIFKPIAKVEYWLRGKHSQVVIEENYRGGQPTYGYGPFE